MSAAPAEVFIAALRARRSITEKVMIVVAHPDDETIGIGAQLCRFEDLLIVHATDGAPRDMHDAARYGFACIEDYVAARRREISDALIAGGAGRARTLAFDIPDQEACRDLFALTGRIAGLLISEKPQAVFTHAYEGGHPDHDSCAFAVHAAAPLSSNGSAPAIIEMALYHRRDGDLVSGDFLPAEPPVTVLPLDPGDLRRKQRMIDAFATQRWLLSSFPLDCERLRIAPEYDFRLPPHPGVLHYETLGWGITGTRWRDHAAAALAKLDLADLPCL
jgi:LmbE family N-acetylglucosaminyl deacetylase